jgi:hypothetical protein
MCGFLRKYVILQKRNLNKKILFCFSHYRNGKLVLPHKQHFAVQEFLLSHHHYCANEQFADDSHSIRPLLLHLHGGP